MFIDGGLLLNKKKYYMGIKYDVILLGKIQ